MQYTRCIRRLAERQLSRPSVEVLDDPIAFHGGPEVGEENLVG